LGWLWTTKTVKVMTLDAMQLLSFVMLKPVSECKVHWESREHFAFALICDSVVFPPQLNFGLLVNRQHA